MKTQTTIIFDMPAPVKQTTFRMSYRFDVPAVYCDGIHYFPNDITNNNRQGEINSSRCNLNQGQVNDKPYEIQAVYYSYKWFQDTHFISKEFKNELEEFYKNHVK